MLRTSRRSQAFVGLNTVPLGALALKSGEAYVCSPKEPHAGISYGVWRALRKDVKMLIVLILFPFFIVNAGCNPVQEIRDMRERDRQAQNENNAKQLKNAMENYSATYEELNKAEKPSIDSSNP